VPAWALSRRSSARRSYTGGVSKRTGDRQVAVSVTLDVAPDDVKGNLAAAGLKITATHDLLQIVSGTVDEADIDRLMKVEGVAAVEPDRDVRAFGSPGD
jgi:hypothetical protein